MVEPKIKEAARLGSFFYVWQNADEALTAKDASP